NLIHLTTHCHTHHPHSPPFFPRSPPFPLGVALSAPGTPMASINDLATAAIASSSARKRGAFIVLEGLDRSGKTTQVKLLEQRFVEEGRPVKVMRFPDRTTPIGQMIDAYLKSDIEMDDHAIHLLFSANRWEAVKQINALLAAGTTIICDRFYHSGIVYSAAKQNPMLSLSWARAPDRGLPRPDLVLFLDLDEAQARARGGWGGEVYEKAEMQRTVRKLFREMIDGEAGGDEGLGDEGLGGLVAVDASRSVEEVAEDVWGRVREVVWPVDDGEAGRTVRVLP
ncbi:Thymidylate kinase, partial [Tolypocladium ophioglossoides CBS 100239]